MGKELKHPDPDAYAKDLKGALDEFEDALLKRYEADFDEHKAAWTPHGVEPAAVGHNFADDQRAYYECNKHAEEWAADGREWVREAIVDYGTQDLNKLASAFDDLKSVSRLLGNGRKAGDDKGIPEITNSINDKCDFATWSGSSGQAFKDNFGKSVNPTMVSQSTIAGSLANLYSGRACIIDAARQNTINSFKRAAGRLLESEDSGHEAFTWFYVGLATAAIGVASTGVGTVISVGATVGSLLDGKDPDQEFTNDVKGVVKQLIDDLGKAGSDANTQEDELFDKVIELQKDIKSVESKKLELYDFTGGEDDPGAPDGGFDVSVDDVYKFAKLSFDASQEYEGVITKAIAADGADSQMAGEGHVETAADTELIDTKDGLVSFLKTTCARYYEAGERICDAARAYTGTESTNKDIIKALENGPDLNGSDKDGTGGSVDDHSKASDRGNIEDMTDEENPPEPTKPGGPSAQ